MLEEALPELFEGSFYPPAKGERENLRDQSGHQWRGRLDVHFDHQSLVESLENRMKREMCDLINAKTKMVEQETRGEKQKNDSYVARVIVGVAAAAGVAGYVLAHW
jgi:hypothetical protein